MIDMAVLSTEPLDPRDPNPWVAMYLDRTVPIADEAKRDWLGTNSSRCRQFLLPLLRPLSRAAIIFVQLLRILVPNRLSSSRLLHRILCWGLRTWVSPEANRLILRHFHIGTEVLDFVARNVKNVALELHPLKPVNLEAVRDDLFLQHDLNLYNFIIRLNTQLLAQQRTVTAASPVDFGGISENGFPIEPMPNRWTNFIDLETAIELFTPVYQLFLTDNDFWRACNSLQLDETVGLYVAHILQTPEHLLLVNNKHPLVPLTTQNAGYRLVLHGLSAEMLHALLVSEKKRQRAGNSLR